MVRKERREQAKKGWGKEKGEEKHYSKKGIEKKDSLASKGNKINI